MRSITLYWLRLAAFHKRVWSSIVPASAAIQGALVSALHEFAVSVSPVTELRNARDNTFHVEIAPGIPGTKPLFAALESFVGGLSGLSGLNFLSPRAVIARDWLTRALNDAGARIDLVYAYRIQSSPGVDPGRTAAMFSAATDCIVLTSPASVVLLTRLFDSDDLGEVLAKVRIGVP